MADTTVRPELDAIVMTVNMLRHHLTSSKVGMSGKHSNQPFTVTLSLPFC